MNYLFLSCYFLYESFLEGLLKQILILGASGMWGHQVFLKLSRHFGLQNVACSIHKPVSAFSHLGLFQGATIYDGLDFYHFTDVQRVLEAAQPKIVINCVGLTPRKHPILQEHRYYRINSELPHYLLNWCKKNQAKLIHFSTDCVFSGRKGEYTESDLPDATDTYGHSKALGEINDPDALTFRLSKIGRELEYKTEILEWFLSQKGKTVTGYSRAFYSGLTTNFMAKELVRIIEHFPRLSGLYQISGEKISKYDLLTQMNRIFDCHSNIVEKADYVIDKTLRSDLYMKKTGFQMPSWVDMLTELKREDQKIYDSLI